MKKFGPLVFVWISCASFWLVACGKQSGAAAPPTMDPAESGASAGGNTIATAGESTATGADAGGAQAQGGTSGAPGSAASAASGKVTPSAENTSASPTADISNLTALGPNGLAQKILTAFGRGMTMTTVNKMPVDFFANSGSLFTGSISPDPTQVIPAKLESTSYFMALAGLSNIVATNYAAALKSATAGAVANDCTTPAGAEAIVQALYPPTSAADAQRVGELIASACQGDGPATAVQGLVYSFAMAVNSTN